MQVRRARTLDAGRRVQAFLGDNAAVIGSTVTAVLRGKFDDAVARLAEAERDQAFATDIALSETTAGEALRRDVYDQFIAPIATAAQMVLRDAPEFAAMQMTAEFKQERVFLAKGHAVLEEAIA